MFDPERDDDPSARRFYARLLAVALVTAAGCLALWPSVTGFSTGPDHQTGCLAITNGWHGDRPAPNAADVATLQTVFPAPPTDAQRNDPAAMARWHTQFEAAQQNPVVQDAYAYDAWIDGPGSCIRASRHRLIISGIGLAALAVVVTGVGLARRRTRKGPAPERRADPELVNA